MRAHIYFPVSICVAYTVELPEGMSVEEVARGLNDSGSFFNQHLCPDLTEADWNYDDPEWDDWTDELDFTAEQVLAYIGKE